MPVEAQCQSDHCDAFICVGDMAWRALGPSPSNSNPRLVRHDVGLDSGVWGRHIPFLKHESLLRNRTCFTLRTPLRRAPAWTAPHRFLTTHKMAESALGTFVVFLYRCFVEIVRLTLDLACLLLLIGARDPQRQSPAV